MSLPLVSLFSIPSFLHAIGVIQQETHASPSIKMECHENNNVELSRLVRLPDELKLHIVNQVSLTSSVYCTFLLTDA